MGCQPEGMRTYERLLTLSSVIRSQPWHTFCGAYHWGILQSLPITGSRGGEWVGGGEGLPSEPIHAIQATCCACQRIESGWARERETSSKNSSPSSPLPVRRTQKPQCHRHPLNFADLYIVTVLVFILPHKCNPRTIRTTVLWGGPTFGKLMETLQTYHATNIYKWWWPQCTLCSTARKGCWRSGDPSGTVFPANTTCECSSLRCQQATPFQLSVCMCVSECV